MKINPKSEKGAITLIVLVAMLFLTAFLMSMYISIANKARTSAETTEQIAEQYNNIGEANTIYDSYFADTDVIPIYTREQLEKIGSGEQITINGKIYTFAVDAYYTIQDDLDLGGYYDETTGTWTAEEGDEWEALPLTDDEGIQYTFTGVLDGLGHTISGIYINNTEESKQGLFGTLEGTVKNLNIENSYINANEYVGAIAGINNGTIQNCKNEAVIIGNNNIGGITGTNNDTLDIEYMENIVFYNEYLLDENNVLKANAKYTDDDGEIAIIPKGFNISEETGEKEIETGLVIKDLNNNEFVWIPVTEDLGETYSYSSNYTEPKELNDTYNASGAIYDSQTTLNYLYGEGHYNYSEQFKYVQEYDVMRNSVNQNNGFYIGKYETTIDSEGNIGSVYNTTVLTAGATLFTKDDTNYPYTWYGLYYEQKNANVIGNGTNVQTAMIYGVLWDKTMEFIKKQNTLGNTTYKVDESTEDWHKGSSIVKTGQANPGATGDVALNIWDLEANCYEWTQEAENSNLRVYRGRILWWKWLCVCS